MGSRFERLQNLLGQEDVYEEKKYKPPATEQENADIYSTDSGDDEKILNIASGVGGELQQSLGYAREIQTKHVVKLPSYNLKIGELAPPDEVFCSLQTVLKYPYYCIEEKNRNIVAGNYFAKGKIFEQPWDLFYIYPPEEISTRAILLIPSKQLYNLLAIINRDLRTQLAIPFDADSSGFLTSFTEQGIQRPRYLGHSHDRDMSENLRQAVLPATYRPSDESPLEPTDRSLEAFKKKIELLIEHEKNKKKASKEKRNLEKRERQLAWNRSIKKVQKYLGIRKSRDDIQAEARASVRSNGLEWIDPAALHEALEKMTLEANVFSTEKAPMFAPEQGVVFISVDVEAYERNHKLVTEVGIATLDTNDIFKMAPGENAKNWREAIRARHFRISEYSHLNNHEFIQGCADKFEFGKSEWVSKSQLPQMVAACFKEPFSGDYEPTPESVLPPGTSLWDLDNASLKKRQLVLVGHDTKQDIQYLKQIGYDPNNLSNLIEVMDTVQMYRALMRESDPRSLGYVLADLGITGWYLHNAGNDAVYTLQAMLGIAVKELVMKADAEAIENLTKKRVAESVEIAVQTSLEQIASWESDGEGSDGGIALHQEDKKSALHSGGSAAKINAGDDSDTPDTPNQTLPHPPKKAASGKCKMLAKQVARGEEVKVVEMLAERGEVDERLLSAMETVVAGKASDQEKNFLEGEIERCRELSMK